MQLQSGSALMTLVTFGRSHLDDGCVDERLEADEAGIPIISCSAVHRAAKTVSWNHNNSDKQLVF